MMRYIIFFVIIILNNRIPASADNTAFFRAHNIVTSANNDETEIRKAIAILSEDITQFPENIQSLKFRAQLYSSIGEHYDAYSDIKFLVKIKPKSSVYYYSKCIFEESFGYTKDECIACYEKVLDLMAEELGDKKDGDLGYIFVLLLAEKPLGRHLADKYAATLTNSTFDEFNKDLLLNFDRRKFLPAYRKPSP